MIEGGITTLYVSDMERSIEFYTKTLGLELRNRHGNYWAEVVAGKELTLGLHPMSDDDERRGGEGAALPSAASPIKIGLKLDRPLDEVVEVLTARNVVVEGPVQDGGPVRLAYFCDPDGNPFYLFEYVQVAH